ncbi:MAG: glycosyltransferase [Elusimicrobiales bacterium]|nr:glycosyltransferase [Elusimicrobiales bacterium]
MKILYVITSTTRGGAENTLHTIISGIDRRRYQPVCAVSLKPLGPVAGAIAKTGVPVKSLNMGFLPSPSHAAQLARLFREYKPDIVHALLFRAIQFSRFAARGTGIRLITSPRVNYRTRPKPLQLLDKWARTENELVICESEATREYMIERLGYRPDRTGIIRNGVDSEKWVFSPQARAEKRKALGLRENELFIVTAGRLDEQKGQRYLIEALPLLNRRGISPKIAILGDGPLKPDFLSEISKNKLNDCVLLPGEQEDVLPWLCAADIFVLPSLWEGTPNALMEAMSAGLACVASGVDGVNEIAQDGVTALLVPPADPQALRNAIERLALNPELRQTLGKAARDYTRTRLSAAKMITACEAAYDMTLQG